MSPNDQSKPTAAVLKYRRLNRMLDDQRSVGISDKEETSLLGQIDLIWFNEMTHTEQVAELGREAAARRAELGQAEDFHIPRFVISRASILRRWQ